VGALVLGVGLGALAAPWLGRAAVAVLVVGLAVHGWGMYDKHRLEQGSGAAEMRYAEALYQVCWLMLAVLLAWLVARTFAARW
jgi:hypothetical protein